MNTSSFAGTPAFTRFFRLILGISLLLCIFIFSPPLSVNAQTPGAPNNGVCDPFGYTDGNGDVQPDSGDCSPLNMAGVNQSQGNPVSSAGGVTIGSGGAAFTLDQLFHFDGTQYLICPAFLPASVAAAIIQTEGDYCAGNGSGQTPPTQGIPTILDPVVQTNASLQSQINQVDTDVAMVQQGLASRATLQDVSSEVTSQMTNQTQISTLVDNAINGNNMIQTLQNDLTTVRDNFDAYQPPVPAGFSALQSQVSNLDAQVSTLNTDISARATTDFVNNAVANVSMDSQSVISIINTELGGDINLGDIHNQITSTETSLSTLNTQVNNLDIPDEAAITDLTTRIDNLIVPDDDGIRALISTEINNTTFAIDDVSGLQTVLDGKTGPTDVTSAISNISLTDLPNIAPIVNGKINSTQANLLVDSSATSLRGEFNAADQNLITNEITPIQTTLGQNSQLIGFNSQELSNIPSVSTINTMIDAKTPSNTDIIQTINAELGSNLTLNNIHGEFANLDIPSSEEIAQIQNELQNMPTTTNIQNVVQQEIAATTFAIDDVNGLQGALAAKASPTDITTAIGGIDIDNIAGLDAALSLRPTSSIVNNSIQQSVGNLNIGSIDGLQTAINNTANIAQLTTEIDSRIGALTTNDIAGLTLALNDRPTSNAMQTSITNATNSIGIANISGLQGELDSRITTSAANTLVSSSIPSTSDIHSAVNGALGNGLTLSTLDDAISTNAGAISSLDIPTSAEITAIQDELANMPTTTNIQSVVQQELGTATFGINKVTGLQIALDNTASGTDLTNAIDNLDTSSINGLTSALNSKTDAAGVAANITSAMNALDVDDIAGLNTALSSKADTSFVNSTVTTAVNNISTSDITDFSTATSGFQTANDLTNAIGINSTSLQNQIDSLNTSVSGKVSASDVASQIASVTAPITSVIGTIQTDLSSKLDTNGVNTLITSNVNSLNTDINNIQSSLATINTDISGRMSDTQINAAITSATGSLTVSDINGLQTELSTRPTATEVTTQITNNVRSDNDIQSVINTALGPNISLSNIETEITANESSINSLVIPDQAAITDLTDRLDTLVIPDSSGIQTLINTSLSSATFDISDITNLQTSLDDKAATSAMNSSLSSLDINSISGLNTALADKAATSSITGSINAAIASIPMSNISGLNTALNDRPTDTEVQNSISTSQSALQTQINTVNTDLAARPTLTEVTTEISNATATINNTVTQLQTDVSALPDSEAIVSLIDQNQRSNTDIIDIINAELGDVTLDTLTNEIDSRISNSPTTSEPAEGEPSQSEPSENNPPAEGEPTEEEPGAES